MSSEKSLAVVNYASEKGAVEIREIIKPAIDDEDVLLEVEYIIKDLLDFD